MSVPGRGGRRKGLTDRWQQWQKKHGINFPSLSPAERLRVRELYMRETQGTRNTTIQQQPNPVPADTGTGTAPLPEHLVQMGASAPSAPPIDPSPPQPEVRFAPATIWATLWDLFYRGRAALQYYPAVREHVPFAEVERIWTLSEDAANHLGEATATAWDKYVPAASPANAMLQQVWPAIALGAAVIMTEKAKGDEWAGLIQILRNGPAVPPQYEQPTQPVEPVAPAPANPWEEMARGNGHGPTPPPVLTAADPTMDQPTVSYRDQLAAAGADVSAIPPNGVGLRQALTKSIGPSIG